MIYLDTHVVVWIYAGLKERFPERIWALLNKEELWVSPMVVLELQYLFEIGRTTEPSTDVMPVLQSRIGLQVCEKDFASVVFMALAQDWTRDPFDRIIVSQASLNQTMLISKDSQILKHYSQAIWE